MPRPQKFTFASDKFSSPLSPDLMQTYCSQKCRQVATTTISSNTSAYDDHEDLFPMDSLDVDLDDFDNNHHYSSDSSLSPSPVLGPQDYTYHSVLPTTDLEKLHSVSLSNTSFATSFSESLPASEFENRTLSSTAPAPTAPTTMNTSYPARRASVYIRSGSQLYSASPHSLDHQNLSHNAYATSPVNGVLHYIPAHHKNASGIALVMPQCSPNRS